MVFHKEENINEYADYFHDGTVHDIFHKKNKLTISMESAELLPEWNKDNIMLSKRKTISGKLHINQIDYIQINRQKYTKILRKMFDIGNIYDFSIRDFKLVLLVSWDNYSIHPPEETDVFTIEVNAKKIYWENIPTLFDAYWDALDD